MAVPLRKTLSSWARVAGLPAAGEQFVGPPADQLAFIVAAAAFHQRLIHDHIFAAAVFDEEDQVGQAVKQRLAGERFGELRKELG